MSFFAVLKSPGILKHRNSNCFIEKLNRIEIKTKVKITVENITPYYDESKEKIDEKVGENCGWKCGEEQKFMDQFLNKINKKYIGEDGEDSNNKKEGNISFGLCIDFCHIFASYILRNPLEKDIQKKNRALCDAMDSYFSFFREGEKFHLKIMRYLNPVCVRDW